MLLHSLFNVLRVGGGLMGLMVFLSPFVPVLRQLNARASLRGRHVAL